MIDWNKVADFREGRYVGLSEEEMIGTGRTTTMLINVLDYVTKIAAVAPSAVIIIPSRVMFPQFKDHTKSLAKDMGLFVTDETLDSLHINNCQLHFCTENDPGTRGRGKIFVDHGVKMEDKNNERI